MVSVKYKLSSKALKKITFHGLKYPSNRILGVLLCNGSCDDHDLLIVDAIPLFHSWPSPLLLEAALSQVESFSKKYKLLIAGYYEGLDTISSDLQPSSLGLLLASKLAEFCLNSCILLIDELSFVERYQFAFKLLLREKGNWITQDEDSLLIEKLTSIEKEFAETRYRSLYDFEDHLKNPSLNWLASY
ncbi:ER membrane protein complex subunit 8/9 homolog [Zophobas morio]|uniref:ER membrane protein complex subunit 8/9 homolog n=1 Tax=Zophobas morio TaxID=2755281 RepID=UPI0030835ED1